MGFYVMCINKFLPKNCYNFIIYAWIAVAILLLLFVNQLPVRINFSASMPRGIYRLTGNAGEKGSGEKGSSTKLA